MRRNVPTPASTPNASVSRDAFAPGSAHCDNATMWWLAHGEHDVPASADWLSPREHAILATLRYTKRRIEFLARRWTAKRAVATVLDRALTPAALATVEIRHHPGGAPYLEVDGRPVAIDVSLSDRAGWAVCLVGPQGGSRGPIGIDLELVEPRSAAFVDDYFTADESAYVCRLAAGEARDEAANLIWAAKEAALKVRKVGLRADTREVAVEIGHARRPDGWTPLSVAGRDGTVFPGWWRRDGVFLLTVVASSEPSPPPVRLAGGGDLADAVPVHSWLAQPLA
jgi:4'-phosphopantetheinyl transferase